MSKWFDGLKAAEKSYSQHQFVCGRHDDPEYLHDWIVKSMKQDLDIDSQHGFKCNDYLDGFSDYIWQLEYNRK